jgi:ribonuclease D
LLREQLGSRGHWDWACEECQVLCREEEYRFDPIVQAHRVKKARGLNARNWAVLQALVAVRDRAAREHDVPPRTMLRDEILVVLAKHPAKTLEQLAEVRGLPRPVEHAYGKDIVEATLAALQQPLPPMPESRMPEEATEDRVRIDGLFAAISAYSYGRGIDPLLVGNRQDVASSYRTLCNGDRSAPDAHLLRGWRGQLLSQLFSQFLSGDASITLAWRDGRLAADSQG